jgi:hypothetical protein
MGVVYDETSGADYATLSAAISGSSANDVLLVPAGSYDENFPNITHNLTIDAVGGLASLTTPQPMPVNGRAIINVPGDAGVSLTISGLEISGAVDAPGTSNGAGILFETGNGLLTVKNSWIHNNQDGILTGGPDAASPGGVMSVTISHSEINNNGVDPSNSRFGFDHNIYAGALTQLTVTDSYIHDALGGHEIKSRALINVITGNRIQDGPTAQTSYSIDLADGGIDTVSGNTIEKGASAQNSYMIHFGGEGTYLDSSLVVSGNIFINDRSGGATAVYNQTRDPNPEDQNYNANIPATITGNTLYNVEQPNLYQDNFGPPLDTVSNNVFPSGPGPALDTSPGYDVAEPASVAMFLFAVLGVAALRFVGGRGIILSRSGYLTRFPRGEHRMIPHPSATARR